jgi:hypothetical protein
MEQTPTKELAKSIKIKIQDNEYTIKFPNIGQIIDIESNKIGYSNGRYSQMARSGIVSTNIALELVEMTATFSVVIPQFITDLRVTSLFDLDPIAAKELCKEYREKFVPWYSEWIMLLKEEDKETTK